MNRNRRSFLQVIHNILLILHYYILRPHQHLLSLHIHFRCFINYLLHNNQRFETELSVLAIIKNEAPYLKEWIEYHKLAGVQKFYLYDNYSEDNTYDVLKPYIDAGEVCYTKWPIPENSSVFAGERGGVGINFEKLEQQLKPCWFPLFRKKLYRSELVQVNAYNHALKVCRNKTKYLAIIDLDEFIVPVQKDNLLDVIREIEARHPKNSIAAIHAYWTGYGFGGHRHKPDGMVIENYTRRAAFSAVSVRNRHIKLAIKTIVNPRAVIKYHVHDGIYLWFKKKLWIDPEELRINHYWTKSYDEFCEKMLKRNRNWADDKYPRMMVEYDPNFSSDVEDRVMDRFIPRLKERLGQN